MAEQEALSSGIEFELKERFESPQEAVNENLDSLIKFGGFDFVDSLIDGVDNLNPEKKAKRKIFLSDDNKKEDRSKLQKNIAIWLNLLNDNENLESIAGDCQARADQADKTYKKNIKKVLETARDLEVSYRTVASFFKNTESTKIKNLTIVNAAMDDLKNLDNPRFIDAVQEELVNNYDRLDLRNNYSLLVVPGYLGSNTVVDKWAKIAYENKVMMVTDFENLDDAESTLDWFEAANMTGGDIYKKNVLMTCNWLVGRGKDEESGEDEDIYIPSSAALAGKIYQTLPSQPTAGKKWGGINEIEGVRFDMKKSEITQLEKAGLIPMVDEFGKVMAFSAKTLFNGDNLGFQTYSVVRVFDYVSKVLMDFLNRRAFEAWNSKTEKELRGQIVKFLDSICGPNNLIDKFKIMRLEQDKQNKDRIHLDIHMSPFFPAKNFLISLDGHKGDDDSNMEWDSSISQE